MLSVESREPSSAGVTAQKFEPEGCGRGCRESSTEARHENEPAAAEAGSAAAVERAAATPEVVDVAVVDLAVVDVTAGLNGRPATRARNWASSAAGTSATKPSRCSSG